MSDLSVLAPLAALGSALAHSVMALFTKKSGDTLVFRAVTISISALLLVPIMLTHPIPDLDVWRYLLMSAGVIWAFNMAMIAAFERGDMNLVYPVMRGAAPVLTAVLAFQVFGEALTPWGIAGLVIASMALIAFAWPESGGLPKLTALGFALGASVMTASYTVIDAAGARIAQSPWVYVSWFFLISALTLTATAVWRRGWTRFKVSARQELRIATYSSFFNVTTYGLALWAYANAPVAPMAALRETSIVFGAILAAWVLKEGFGIRRAILAIVLAAGLILLQLSRS